MNLGPVELFLLLFGSLMGLPPGEHDAALVHCAPKDAIVYVEWSQRSGGIAGGTGIDGLAGDPEVQRFLGDVEKAIISSVQEKTAGRNDKAKIAAKHVPALIHQLLVRPGCFYGTYDAKPAAKAADESGGPPSPAAMLAGLRGALVVNGGDQADAIEAALRALLAEVPKFPKDGEFKKISIPLDGLSGPLVVHRHKNYFIVAISAALVDQAVDGLEGKAKGLLDNPRFVEAEKRVHSERTASVTWIDVHSTLSGVTSALGPVGGFVESISKLIGTSDIDSIVYETGVVNGQIQSKSFVETGGHFSGILALAGGRSLRPEDFAHVPADADLVAGWSLNHTKIYDELERIVGGTSLGFGEVLRDRVKQLEDRLGFQLKGDLFKAFGEVWTLYDSPSEGGLFVTSLVAGLEVRDAAKAKLVYDRLKKLIKENLPGRHGSFRESGTLLEEKTFLGQKISFVNAIGGDTAVAPSFCLTDSQLLFALHPQAIKAHLRFVKGRGQALAPAVGGSGPSSEGATVAYAALDMKRLVRLAYAFAPYVAQKASSELQKKGVPIDVFSLPSARAILPYVGRCEFRVTRTDKGILTETQSSLPLPGIAALSLALSMTNR